jgi:peroxiredoxin Q/BCP
MKRSRNTLLALLLLSGAGPLWAQSHGPLPAGQAAPDFSLPGATRAGPLASPVHLADLRGQTVVLAFFYKARTKG